MPDFDYSSKAQNGISYSSQIANHMNMPPTQNFISIISRFETFSLDESQNTIYDLYDAFVQENIRNLENIDEKILLITMVYVGKSSAKYWSENLQKWSNLSTNVNTYSRNPAPGILASDIGGGIVGAAIGAYSGAIGGTIAIPGIGTVAGVTAGFFVGGAIGGIRSSATAGITAFISHLFH